MNLFTKTVVADSGSKLETGGHFLLRVSVGLMVFYVHGWHKLEGWIAYLQNGTPWKLAEEVAGMHFPAPLASAVAATLVQFICSLFIIVGLFTRINALLLFGALSGAILQNLQAGRDPQLAILYALVILTLAFMGGGRISLDARLFANAEHSTSRNDVAGKELKST
jgi:putative oxidoreductase